MEIDNLISQLRESDWETFNAAYSELRLIIAAAKASVYRAVRHEPDLRAKGALIELLGESKDKDFIPYLAGQLKSEQVDLQFWAFTALQNIATADSLGNSDKAKIHYLLSEFYANSSR